MYNVQGNDNNLQCFVFSFKSSLANARVGIFMSIPDSTILMYMYCGIWDKHGKFLPSEWRHKKRLSRAWGFDMAYDVAHRGGLVQTLCQTCREQSLLRKV